MMIVNKDTCWYFKNKYNILNQFSVGTHVKFRKVLVSYLILSIYQSIINAQI